MENERARKGSSNIIELVLWIMFLKKMMEISFAKLMGKIKTDYIYSYLVHNSPVGAPRKQYRKKLREIKAIKTK